MARFTRANKQQTSSNSEPVAKPQITNSKKHKENHQTAAVEDAPSIQQSIEQQPTASSLPKKRKAVQIKPDANLQAQDNEVRSSLRVPSNTIGPMEQSGMTSIIPQSSTRKRRNLSEDKSPFKVRKVVLHVPELPKVSGAVLVVGQGDTGQLGLGEDVLERSRFALVNTPSPVVAVAAGGMHTVFLTVDGEVYTFGCNDEGALGRDTSNEGSEFIPGKVDVPEKVVQVSAGDSHSSCLTEHGQVYIWGNFRDSNGSMGLTPFGPQPKPSKILSDVVVVQVASGNDHLACLADDGTLYTLGCAEQGQLGRVAEFFSKRGGRKGLGYILNPGPVRVSRTKGHPSQGFDRIWAGSYFTFGKLRDSDEIYGFGLNNHHQLGIASQEKICCYAPEHLPSFSGKQWRKISGGQHHTLALDGNGAVYSVGRKEYGCLGLGENCEDKNSLTVVPSLQSQNCSDISCGINVSFAVSEGGVLYSWGAGTVGQLGHGDEDDVYTPKAVSGAQLASRSVLMVTAGGQHTVILAYNSTETSKTSPE